MDLLTSLFFAPLMDGGTEVLQLFTCMRAELVNMLTAYLGMYTVMDWIFLGNVPLSTQYLFVVEDSPNKYIYVINHNLKFIKKA